MFSIAVFPKTKMRPAVPAAPLWAAPGTAALRPSFPLGLRAFCLLGHMLVCRSRPSTPSSWGRSLGLFFFFYCIGS